jgi:hypothetical protein
MAEEEGRVKDGETNSEYKLLPYDKVDRQAIQFAHLLVRFHTLEYVKDCMEE